jgi:hypothetical protein
MKTNLNDLNNEDINIFNEIQFNRDEIKGTDETFFNDENDNNNSNYSLELEKSEEDYANSDKLDICDKSMEEEMNKVTLNDKDEVKIQLNKKKISKGDLNTIPLPIFECIFCANEKLSFNHLINDEFSLKYLYNIEKKDISLINFLQDNDLLLPIENEKDNIVQNFINKNNINLKRLQKIVKMILENTEYVSKYYTINESHNLLKQKRRREENKKVIKYNNNKLDFEKKKYGKEKNDLFEDDNSSDSIEKVNNICNNIIKTEKEGEENKSDKCIEENICDSFNKLLDDCNLEDLSRKIKWSDIIWEDKPYNIWDNSIDDKNIEFDENSK